MLILEGQTFFEPGFPILFNRETESFTLALHSHDFLEISLVEEGRGYQFLREQVVPVQKGDLFLLPIGASHVFRPSSTQQTEPLIISNCIFQREALSDLMHLIPENSILNRVLFHAQPARISSLRDHHDQFLDLFKKAYFEYKQKEDGYQSMVKSYLLQILLLIHRTLTNAQASHSNPPLVNNQKIKDAIQFIHTHYDQPLTLTTMSELTYMSSSQFQEQFKHATGQSFKRYLQHVRIQRSCELLKTTDHTVQQIAQKVGYSDMKFYHSLFLRITGMTPRLYRRQYFLRLKQ